MKKALFLISFVLLSAPARAELAVSVDSGVSGITSNSVIDIDHDSASVWIGTGGGASVTTDGGVNWTTFGAGPLPTDEVSAMAVNQKGVWVGSSHSQSAQGTSYPFGDGLSLTRDGGHNWSTHKPEQASYYGKLSYDLALYDSIAYAACFYGGLIRSTDLGVTWQNLFPSQLDSINTDSVDYATYTFLSFDNRFFAVKTDLSNLPHTLSVWGGSANGLFRFMFNADTSTGAIHTYPDSIAHYYFLATDTTIADSLKLPGNHVVAIGINQHDSVKTVWVACRPVYSGEARRIGYSSDDGVTWHTANITDPSGDHDVEGWDFAFAGDTTYVATSFGLYKSTGNYSTWTLLSGFHDSQNQTIYWDNSPFYAVDIAEGAVWAGGADGVVKSVSNGWQVFRADGNPNDHYAYPSPFSPEQSVRHGTTIHFKPSTDTKATVKIFDFNLELVKTVASDLPRRGGVESDDIVWDGKNDKGTIVANGVYFYRIELSSGDDLWGKIVVIK
jgi:hypothetical protein